MSRTISNILIIVFSAIIAFSGFRLWKIFHEYHEGEKQYSDTASRYQHTKDPDNTLADNDPQVCPITVDFDSLKALNPDVVGWIYSADTQINYPVLLGEDNSEYLHHMVNGEYNSAGSIFMDCRNKPDLSDFNTILYGHHMKNGSMFASLHQYTEQELPRRHPSIRFLLIGMNWTPIFPGRRSSQTLRPTRFPGISTALLLFPPAPMSITMPAMLSSRFL